MKKFRSAVFIILSAMLVFTACGKKEEALPETQQAENTKAAAEELAAMADKLGTAVEEAFKKGVVDQARYDEFKGYVSRIAEIKNSGSDTDELKEELASIKSELAAIASQVSASNDMIDDLVAPDERLDVKKNSAEKPAESTSASAQAPAPSNGGSVGTLKSRVQEFSSNYISLQNEMSRKVDLGEISQEDYTALIQTGIEIAQLKEKTDIGQATQDIENEFNTLKANVYDFAVKAGSDIADKFK